jgi:hypothetical protein
MAKQLNITFYQNVARLFYAIAFVDKTVKEEEVEALKKIVREEWLDLDETEDEYKTDAAYQIETVFDWLVEQEFHANQCFDEFIEYKNEHDYFFTSDINALLLKTAGVIASAFAGKNKSELIMLAKLNRELQKV